MSVAVAGATVTATGGFSVIVADALLVVSATLTAVTVALVCAGILEGAVYRPAEVIEPAPVRVQVTAVFVDPVTFAVNCRVCDTVSVAAVGDTATATGGTKVTVEDAFLVGSPTLVAITKTVCPPVIDAGAVYNPEALTDPTDGLIDHVTEVLPIPVTVAVNCCI